MKRIILTILLVTVAGCGFEREDRTGQYAEVSKKIEQVKADQNRAGQRKSLPVGVDAGNIAVTVNLLTTSEQNYSAISGIVKVSAANVRGTLVKRTSHDSGLTVILADENIRAQLSVAKDSLRSSEETEILLVTAANYPARIFVGKQISVPVFVYAGRRYTATEYDFVTAGRSLEVVASVLADGKIKMTLTPVFSSFLPGGYDLELTELSTTVTAEPGESIIIASSDTDSQNVANALLSSATQNTSTRTLVTVTPSLR